MIIQMVLSAVIGVMFGLAIGALMNATGREEERRCMESELKKHIKRADDLKCQLNHEQLKREIEVRRLKAELEEERYRHDLYVDFELAEAKELEELKKKLKECKAQ